MRQVREEAAADETWPREDVPRVPALEASEIDAERAEGEGHECERPGANRAECAADDLLDQVERREAEQEPAPGGRGHEQDVVPDRRSAPDAEPLEVGDDVQRVREE